MDNEKRAGERVKLDPEVVEWAEKKIEEMFIKKGYGYVALIYHINNGKLDYIEKIARETEKDRKNENDQDQMQGGGNDIAGRVERISGKSQISFPKE